MTEIWKDIKGFEGEYQVSNLGRVKSIKFNKEKILKQYKNNKGYLMIDLYKNNKIKKCQVHRLVAEAFILNPENLPIINHIDENPLNNKIDNLEWCTQKYNTNYGSHNEKLSKALTNNIKLSKPVIGINNINGYIVEYPSIIEAGRVMTIPYQNICQCCKGKRKSAGGYKWIYKEVNSNE